jgi:molybdopterin-guanine dinucleotide biosynthesis adapter protein
VKERLAVAFSGPSNSGKTTLIVRLATLFKKQDKHVFVIKHDPKDKAVFDVKGKDSQRFFACGADVVVTSPTRTTYFSHSKKDLAQTVEMIGEFDLLLIEGHKEWSLPRIGVFYKEIDPGYFDYLDAIALGVQSKKSENIKKIPPSVTLLDLNNTEEIISWIEQHAKQL